MKTMFKKLLFIVGLFFFFSANIVLAEESLNYEAEAKTVAVEFANFFDTIVEDALFASQFDFIDIDSVKDDVANFYKSKNKEIWYNLGSDENPIVQRKTVPLYKEISFINKREQEEIKYNKDGFESDLKDISVPANTEYKSETYFEDAKSLNEGEVYIGKIATNYVFSDEIFRDLAKEDSGKFEKVIARDIMKQGVIRFSAPVYSEGKFIGVLVLSLDYRHFQELAKHIEPGSEEKIVSASYSGNYILVFDVDGNTVIHPKPSNVRGYLPDGTLAGYNETNPKNKGSIFNLFAYDKSQSYPEMAEQVLNDKKVYTSSATDVSGRTKLTVAVPIIYDNPKTNYKDIGVLGGIMMSISLAEQRQETVEEVAIKLKALQVASQIDNYLEKNPSLTLEDLQKDENFQKIAVQQVGETGYTGVMDLSSGYFYFHPQEKLINTDSHALREKLPDFWQIFDKTMGKECLESAGYYDWKEADGSITEKYLYTACVEHATADGKKLFVGATTYIDELTATKYLEKYKIKKDFTYAKDAIEQKAEDVARQIEIYLNSHPEKTVLDLQSDEYFQKIAVQQVGQTGYTAVTDYNSLIARFHSNPKIVNLDLSSLAEKLPGFWNIMRKTRGGQVSAGVYDWVEADGSTKEKYMYIAIIKIKTADGVGLSVAATTYLDEYSAARPLADEEKEEAFPLNLTIIFIFLFGFLVYLFFLLTTTTTTTTTDLKGIVFSFKLFIVSAMLLSLFNVLNIHATSLELGLYFERMVQLFAFFLVFSLSLLSISAAGKQIKKSILALLFLFSGAIAYLVIFTDLFIAEVLLKEGSFPFLKSVNGELYYLLPALMLVFLIIPLIFLIKNFSKNKKTIKPFLYVYAVLGLVIGINIFFYMVLDLDNQYLLLLSAIIFTAVVGIALIKIGLIKQKQNILVVLLSIFLLLLIGLFVFTTYQTTQTIKNERITSAIDQLTSLATSQTNFIADYLEEQKDKIKIATTHSSLTNQELIDIRDSSRNYLEVFVLDENGIIIDSTDKSNIGLDKKDGFYFNNSSKEPYIEPIYYSETLNAVTHSVSVPYKKGVLVAKLNTDSLLEIFADITGLGETGESLLAYRSKDGDAEFFSERRFGEKEEYNIIPKENKNIPITQALLKNENIFMDYNDYRNTPVIAVTKYIDELDVGVVIKRDKQEIIQSITKVINKIWIFTIGMIVLIILIGLIINTILTKSLKKEVEKKTIDIENQSKKIQEELKKEEQITKEKEKLLVEQKFAKKELENKVEELEKFQKLTVNRELKMIELKEKIKKLEKDSK